MQPFILKLPIDIKPAA